VGVGFCQRCVVAGWFTSQSRPTSQSLARLGAHTTGIDASESNIAIAKLHASADPKLSELSYVHTPAESLLASRKRYDVVCSMEVLEHVDNPASFLSTCAELLNVRSQHPTFVNLSNLSIQPGGHLFLSTISRTPLAYFLTILLAEDILRKVSPGTHTHSKFIKPSELVSFFQKYRSSTNSHPARPWISPQSSPELPARTEAEVRGLIYHPLQARWILAPRDAWCTTDCNYIFWVRKPSLS
jgi:polyprenyldihydroxybenzoate methyltransferase/3-demethylubiquinol 3-O-methyltransferase